MSFAKKTLSDQIFKVLRDKIVFMEYIPGMSLSEKDLCKTFKVSRTPLREAIRKLEDRKLVTVIPRYGTFVSPIEINEIRCAFEVKLKLEGLAGEVAAKRITADKLKVMGDLVEKADMLFKENGHRKLIEIDRDFHEIIYSSTQNPILQELLENLQSRCARLWNSVPSESVPIPEVLNGFREIYVALKERNSQRAGQLLENHARFFIDLIKKELL